MDIYTVAMVTDLDEEVYVQVQADSESEALAIGVTMLESGQLDCLGMICVSCSAYLA